MRIAALAGGVGAARFLSGLVQVVDPGDLTVIVNTGDDFQFLGLYICPDIDTVTYTLAGIANPGTGWGVNGDTFLCLERLKQLGADDWFRLGDRDLATHLYRTEQLRQGTSLSRITAHLAETNGIRSRLLPMTDQPVPTIVHTDQGRIEFQDYFVRKRCAPKVTGFSFNGVEQCRPAAGVIESIMKTDCVIVCPSNPFISIGPILSVPDIRQSLRETRALKVSITPMIEGRAVKGPTASMMADLGLQQSAETVALMYRDFLDLFVLDRRDRTLAGSIQSCGVAVFCAETRMDSAEARVRLAKDLLDCIGEMAAHR